MLRVGSHPLYHSHGLFICASVRQSTERLVSSGLSPSASRQSVCLSFSLSFSFSCSPHTPQPSSVPALYADIPQLLLQPRPSPLFPFSQAVDFEPMLAGSFHRCLKPTASYSHLEMCFFPPFSLALSATAGLRLQPGGAQVISDSSRSCHPWPSVPTFCRVSLLGAALGPL